MPWDCFSILQNFKKVDLLVAHWLIVVIHTLISVPSFHSLYGHLRFDTLTNGVIQRLCSSEGLGVL